MHSVLLKVDVGVIQQFLLNTLDSILSLKALASDKVMVNEKVDPLLANSFSESMILRLQESSLKPPYSFLANLLAEVICPEATPRIAWPDEEFLKFTIERYGVEYFCQRPKFSLSCSELFRNFDR